MVDEEEAARRQLRREKKKARRRADKHEHAEPAADAESNHHIEVADSDALEQQDDDTDDEAEGTADFDREVDMLDRDALTRQDDTEARKLGLTVATKSSWTLSAPTGGRFVQCDPIFATELSTGEQVLLTATAQEVQVLSVETSLPIRTCSIPNNQSVVSLTLREASPGSVYCLLRNGEVVVWQWTSDAAELATIPGPGKVVAMADALDDALFCLHNADGTLRITRRREVWYQTRMQLTDLLVTGESDFVIAYGPSAVLLGAKTRSDYVWIEVPIGGTITCLDARLTHSNESGKKKRQAHLSLAIGKSDGQIHVYEDVTSLFAPQAQATLPPPRILHWHREAVSSVKFSRDGNYLVSGGKETVLVLWQLQTGVQQYLPHLTSEIERIVVSPKGDRYAVQLGDNSIIVLSTSELKPVAHFAGLQLAGSSLSTTTALSIISKHAAADRKATAATIHPQRPHQLLLTVPATRPKTATEAATARPFLQTFDLRASRSLMRQALTRNNVTDVNIGPEKTAIASPDVAYLAVSHDGQWLATVDEWMPPASDLEYLCDTPGGVEPERWMRREVYLKFWKWDQGQGMWSLSARIDAPHARADGRLQGAGKVLGLLADPVTVGFITLGEDSRVRMWRPRRRVKKGAVSKVEGEELEVTEWICRQVVELPATEARRADSPLDTFEVPAPHQACLAWAKDGSLLAISLSFRDTAATPALVHFVNAATGKLVTSTSGLAPGEVEAIGILDRYIVVVSSGSINVWDLITNILTHRFNITSGRPSLAVNHKDGTFAVAVRSQVVVYRPRNTQALAREDCGQDIAAILPKEDTGGYTLLFDDATVRTLLYMGAGPRLTELKYASEDAPLLIEDVPEAADEASDVEMTEVLALPAPDDRRRQQGFVLEETEDDRPVVRPEQLASIFDVGQSFAMPPIRDMFAAVMELYGRKPLSRFVREEVA
ncbi:hypothetical protein BAUCODRAFT_125669 [Baudoinia panamericana UAMH 10762]|uniref:Uncharacterized protein n=1 Tax=Baudoinia panamericana (strain UAMH 10762) TaxID=717646 RepID=M2MMP4_BAUPA|nr:uncharacterized protein BAUCODRAFT_125669 [Baudoinia panamericana UAMH 10762]EMC92688.1 hypothetical protein BAUCODRAFT_125669 [Baudoinia panamericana UAMH 10762]